MDPDTQANDTQASDPQASASKWWRVSLRAKGVALLAVPIAALFAALFSVYWMENDVHRADENLVRYYAIRSGLGELRSSLLDGQTALSAYSTTGEPRYLQVYDRARQSIQAAIDRTAAQTSDDPSATTSLAGIRLAITAELQHLDQLRALPPRSPRAAELMERERVAMTNLEARIALFNQYEERRFTDARLQRELARRRLFRTVILCGTLGPLGALFFHLLLTGRLVRRLQAVRENARRLAHGLPLEPLPPGTDEIAALASQLETAATLLQQRERALFDSERRFRELFDHAPVPYEETDRNGAVRRFNQAVCTLLKMTPQQMMGRLAWDFMSPDRQEEARHAMRRRITSGEETGPFECQYLLLDGSRITVEIRENLIRDDRGVVTGTMRSLLDVTERNMAAVAARKVEQYALELRHKNEQLARALHAARSATAAKSRFLASVSHELRTPLNGIIGFSELLYDSKLGPLSGEQVEVIGDILTSARHLLQLINDILDLSKVEAGRMEFRPEHTRLQQLVFEVRDVMRPLADKKSLALTADVPENLLAQIDPGRFKQLLYNYLSNAVKFTPHGGTIKVYLAREREGWFRLEVADTGIGISPEEISRLFQEFAQLPNSRKADQGTGLGLALTRHIVEAQGGSVAVRSEPGKGSVFSAVLPLDSSHAAHAG